MTQDELKQQVALAAIKFIQEDLTPKAVIGVGTGSTADLFIDALAKEKHRFAAAVASSERSAQKLIAHGIQVLDLNEVESLPVYVDGADEITPKLAMIKGGGAALTREKIVSAVAKRFICIADASKLVEKLGKFPLPIEVIPMAHRHVARSLILLSRQKSLVPLGTSSLVKLRMNPAEDLPLVTDNGNYILDVHGWLIDDPVALETEINAIVGVVANGLFAARGANLLLLGTEHGVKIIH